MQRLEFRVREARAEDAPALAAIFREPSVVANTLRHADTTPEDVRALLAAGAGALRLVAVAPDGAVAAFLSLRRHEPEPVRHSGEFFVLTGERWRGRGAARALVEEAVRVAFEEWRLLRLEIEVNADNAPALRLYESLAFDREGVKRGAYARGGALVDCVVMARLAPEVSA